MKKAKVLIDAESAKKLLRGGAVRVRITQEVEWVEIRMQCVEKADPIAKIFDVFFNGRPA